MQASFDLDALLRWRDSVDFGGAVYAGVLVVAFPAMAKTLADTTTEIALPPGLLEALETNHDTGIDIACQMMDGIKQSGAFDGIHLIPVGRYRTVAARLQETGWRRQSPF